MIRLEINSIPIQLISGLYEAPVCTKGVWEKLLEAERTDNYNQICGMLAESIPSDVSEQKLFVMLYMENLRKIREETGLVIPWYPSEPEDKDDKIKYTVYTSADKMVADYARMDIYAVDDISVLEYWLLERDAFITAMSRTKDGRKYLNNAYRLTCTEADEDLEI